MNTNLKQKTILIIEDEKTLRSILKTKLENNNFNVIEARNGKEGLETSLKKHPDLILLDIIMPIMNGMTMLKKLRKEGWGKDAQVMLLTNLDDTEKITESNKQNGYDYLLKTDWSIDDLINKIKNKLK